MNSSNQPVVITPIFQDLDNVPDRISINGETYVLLKDERLDDLKRGFNTLQFVLNSLSNQALPFFDSEHLQAVLEYPLIELFDILNEVNSFKFFS